MDAQYHESRSKMLEEMKTDYYEWIFEMYEVHGKELL